MAGIALCGSVATGMELQCDCRAVLAWGLQNPKDEEIQNPRVKLLPTPSSRVGTSKRKQKGKAGDGVRALECPGRDPELVEGSTARESAGLWGVRARGK